MMRQRRSRRPCVVVVVVIFIVAVHVLLVVVVVVVVAERERANVKAPRDTNDDISTQNRFARPTGLKDEPSIKCMRDHHQQQPHLHWHHRKSSPTQTKPNPPTHLIPKSNARRRRSQTNGTLRAQVATESNILPCTYSMPCVGWWCCVPWLAKTHRTRGSFLSKHGK